MKSPFHPDELGRDLYAHLQDLARYRRRDDYNQALAALQWALTQSIEHGVDIELTRAELQRAGRALDAEFESVA